jgi:hypothetical protein
MVKANLKKINFKGHKDKLKISTQKTKIPPKIPADGERLKNEIINIFF